MSWIWDTIDWLCEKAVEVWDAIESIFKSTPIIEDKTNKAWESAGAYGGSATEQKEHARIARLHLDALSPHCDLLEEKNISMFENYFEKLIKNASPEQQDIYRKEFQKNVVGLKGTLKNYVTSRYSATDSELLPIIKKMQNDQRASDLKKFQKRVLQKAVDLLCDQIRIRTSKQFEFIKNDIEQKVSAKIAIYESTTDQYAAAVKELRNDEHMQNKNMITKAGVTVLKCDVALDLLKI